MKTATILKLIAVWFALIFLGMIIVSPYFGAEHRPAWTYIPGVMGTVLAFTSAYVGYRAAKSWGLNDVFGRTILLLAAYQFFWGVGDLLWDYSNLVLGIGNPYPGLPDIGYFIGSIIGVLSMFLLLRYTSRNLSRRTIVLLALIPLAMLVFNYFAFIQNSQAGASALEIFLNVLYPVADSITFGLVLAVAFSVGSDRLRRPFLLIASSIGVLVLADILFTWSNFVPSASEDWTDAVFFAGYLVLAFGFAAFQQQKVFLNPPAPRPPSVPS